jgi:hypothetical protein
MQAALQGGAAISRPSLPYACARVLLWIRSCAIAGVASDEASNNAAKMCVIFMIRFLDCGFVPSRRLAASANIPDLAVDDRVFLIEGLLRHRRRRGNIGGTRLAVAYRR